jgi:hypothetical protein
LVGVLFGVIFGGVITWVVAHWYYRRASVEVPEWARPIVRALPSRRPKPEEFAVVLRDALEGLTVRVEEDAGDADSCPKCGEADLEEFDEEVDEDNYRVVECGSCGWLEREPL